MTLGEAIEAAKGMAPNTFSYERLTGWVNALEGRVQTDILLMMPAVRYDYMSDSGRELMIRSPYDDIYPMWLRSRIEFSRGDPSYNDSAAMYNSMWMSFAAWFCNTYDPAHTKLTRLGEVDYTAEDAVTIYKLPRYSILTGVKCVVEEAFEGDEGTSSSLVLGAEDTLMSGMDLTEIGESYTAVYLRSDTVTELKATLTKTLPEDSEISSGRAVFYGMVLKTKTGGT